MTGEKFFIIDATITLKVAATSIEEAKTKIKLGQGEVVSYNPPRHECWLHGDVIYTCEQCQGHRCIIGQSSIENPIPEPTICPMSEHCSPSYEGPYSGCVL